MLASAAWVEADAKTCSLMAIPTFFIGVFPYWIRFAQTINKYRETRVKIQLINTGKYFTSIILTVIKLLKETAGCP